MPSYAILKFLCVIVIVTQIQFPRASSTQVAFAPFSPLRCDGVDVCATSRPSKSVQDVRSKSQCVVECRQPECVGVNYRDQENKCDVFYNDSRPTDDDYSKTVPGCLYMQKGRNELPKCDYIFPIAWQSSTWAPFCAADRAVDNNPDNVFDHGSCTATDDPDTNPWWAVDLGQQYHVQGVQLVNRIDIGWRMDNFKVSLTNNAPNIYSPLNNSMTACGQWPGSAPDGATMTVRCAVGLSAFRYLVVTTGRPTLTICEIYIIFQ